MQGFLLSSVKHPANYNFLPWPTLYSFVVVNKYNNDIVVDILSTGYSKSEQRYKLLSIKKCLMSWYD